MFNFVVQLLSRANFILGCVIILQNTLLWRSYTINHWYNCKTQAQYIHIAMHRNTPYVPVFIPLLEKLLTKFAVGTPPIKS